MALVSAQLSGVVTAHAWNHNCTQACASAAPSKALNYVSAQRNVTACGFLTRATALLRSEFFFQRCYEGNRLLPC